eukprot:10074642-Alexandrium_andersonii.AAC.1
MSASLVGSEMCIRDRTCRAWRRTCSCVGMRYAPSRAPRCMARPRSTRTTSCLLYTSDAADDM